jgi:hypothetical protein
MSSLPPWDGIVSGYESGSICARNRLILRLQQIDGWEGSVAAVQLERIANQPPSVQQWSLFVQVYYDFPLAKVVWRGTKPEGPNGAGRYYREPTSWLNGLETGGPPEYLDVVAEYE